MTWKIKDKKIFFIQYFTHFSYKQHNAITFLNKKWYSKKENAILLYFEKSFQICSNYFSCHIHFNIMQVKDKILQEKQSAYIVYVNYTSKFF